MVFRAYNNKQLTAIVSQRLEEVRSCCWHLLFEAHSLRFTQKLQTTRQTGRKSCPEARDEGEEG
jgi:hypothetical protein